MTKSVFLKHDCPANKRNLHQGKTISLVSLETSPTAKTAIIYMNDKICQVSQLYDIIFSKPPPPRNQYRIQWELRESKL